MASACLVLGLAGCGAGHGGQATTGLTGGVSGSGGRFTVPPADGGGASLGGAFGSGGIADVALGTGGRVSTGGVPGSGGTSVTLDGAVPPEDSPPFGGAISTGGGPGTGGTTTVATSSSVDGAMAADDVTGGSGGRATGGSSGTGGVSGTGGSTVDCSFTIITNAISPSIATVGVVEWSTTLVSPTSASIVYTLDNAAPAVQNRGGTAPVDLGKASYRTLLLGLKPASDYTFHIEVSAGATSCRSPDYSLPKTGNDGCPPVGTAGAYNPAQANGYIVTSTGMVGSTVYIIDADGEVVWCTTGPKICSRARMDFEGVNMWMVALNVANLGGEMRYLSMDGSTGQTKVAGLASAHHDFAVLPGKIAAMVWTTSGTDVESNLVEHEADGSGEATTAFKIGANLYAGATGDSGTPTYHSNSILYHAADDSFTIGDRNPNLYVKVKHDGTPLWQIGGACDSAVAPKCAPGTWIVNHGHDFAANGDIVIFNNNVAGSIAHILEFNIAETDTAISTSLVEDFAPGYLGVVLGDVQRLPNGNTLVTFSTAGQIVEVDPSWNVVRSLTGNFGYADWRATLYGPPARL